MGQRGRSRLWSAVIGAVLVLSACTVPKAEQSSGGIASNKTGNQNIVVTKVVSQVLNRESRLPADLVAYRDVKVYPKVQGFIDWIGVDRGSLVKKGDLLIKMSAPELLAQTKQSKDQSKAALEDASQVRQELSVAREELESAKAKAKASMDTYNRLKGAASSYAGVIAGNDLEVAQKTAEADGASAGALEKKVSALEVQVASFQIKHQAAVQAENSTQDIQSYLTIRAAFDGVITERNVHEGSFVHPPSTDTTSIPLLRLQQLSPLRLVVPVPEADVSGIVPGASLKFTVSSFPGEEFDGVVRRIARSVDVGTRTMAVELDVPNPGNRLSPGMFAEVAWPVRRNQPTLFVPPSAIVKTTERTFVVRVRDGVVEWVDVKPGSPAGDLMEIFGKLHEGDRVAVRGTDELREGTHVDVQEQKSAPNDQ